MNSKQGNRTQFTPWVRGILAVAFAAMASSSVMAITSGILAGWTMVFAAVLVFLSLGVVFMIAAGRWTVAPNSSVRYQELVYAVFGILWILGFSLVIIARLLV